MADTAPSCGRGTKSSYSHINQSTFIPLMASHSWPFVLSAKHGSNIKSLCQLMLRSLATPLSSGLLDLLFRLSLSIPWTLLFYTFFQLFPLIQKSFPSCMGMARLEVLLLSALCYTPPPTYGSVLVQLPCLSCSLAASCWPCLSCDPSTSCQSHQMG